jgi:integral membrane protein (TIGR01906 family)
MADTLTQTWTNRILQLSQWVITLLYPVLLTLLAARLVMTPLFLQLEYNRPDFPPDFYGFTTEDRLLYAPYALNYLLNGESIDYLGDLSFPSGGALFNANELRHMVDVKTLTTTAFRSGLATGLLALAAGYLLLRRQGTRPIFRKAILNGSILTLALIAAIVVTAVLNWDYFFTEFHTLFFESGSWRFAYSDTLIRLFPEQFWFDAAITIGGLVTGCALLALVFAWRWRGNHDI